MFELTSQINVVSNHAMWMDEQIFIGKWCPKYFSYFTGHDFFNAQQTDTFILLHGALNLLFCKIEIHDQIPFSFCSSLSEQKDEGMSDRV